MYLLDKYLIPLPRVGTQQWQEKRREGKNEEKTDGAEVKPSTPTQTIDARIGEEEKNRQEKEEQTKETMTGPHPSYQDHLVASYNPQGE